MTQFSKLYCARVPWLSTKDIMAAAIISKQEHLKIQCLNGHLMSNNFRKN